MWGWTLHRSRRGSRRARHPTRPGRRRERPQSGGARAAGRTVLAGRRACRLGTVARPWREAALLDRPGRSRPIEGSLLVKRQGLAIAGCLGHARTGRGGLRGRRQGTGLHCLTRPVVRSTRGCGRAWQAGRWQWRRCCAKLQLLACRAIDSAGLPDASALAGASWAWMAAGCGRCPKIARRLRLRLERRAVGDGGSGRQHQRPHLADCRWKGHEWIR